MIDELRIAEATLVHKASGRSLAVGALLVRGAHRAADTVLLTTGLALGMEGRELADLYYRRWPVQENAFQEANSVGLSEHRGNCGRIVANVAVISELERLASRATRDATDLSDLTDTAVALAQAVDAQTHAHRRAQAALATRRQRLDDLIARGKTAGKAFARVALEHQQALVHAETCTRAATKAGVALDKNVARRTAITERAADLAARTNHLVPQRTIRQLDVAQDSILTATKLTAVQLISFGCGSFVTALIGSNSDHLTSLRCGRAGASGFGTAASA